MNWRRSGSDSLVGRGWCSARCERLRHGIVLATGFTSYGMESQSDSGSFSIILGYKKCAEAMNTHLHERHTMDTTNNTKIFRFTLQYLPFVPSHPSSLSSVMARFSSAELHAFRVFGSKLWQTKSIRESNENCLPAKNRDDPPALFNLFMFAPALPCIQICADIRQQNYRKHLVRPTEVAACDDMGEDMDRARSRRENHVN